MAIENKVGMQGPMTITVKGSDAAMKNGVQKVGKFPPHKDVLQWYVLCSEPSGSRISIYQKDKPLEGDTHLEAWVEGKEYEGKWYFEMFTKEDKVKKDAGGGRFPGGGKSTNYSLEQEAMKDALAIVMQGFVGKVFTDGFNSVKLKEYATLTQKMILDAKKPETPQQ